MRPAEWPLDKLRPVLKMFTRQYHIGLKLQVRFDGSDLVQEALLRAHARADQFQGDTEPELLCWLQKILTNVFIDQCRKAHADIRDVRLEQALQATMAESSKRLDQFLMAKVPDPGDIVQRHEGLVRLARALESLFDDQREAVELHYFHGWKNKEIGALLGRSEGAVAKLVARGVSKLRGELCEGENCRC